MNLFTGEKNETAVQADELDLLLHLQENMRLANDREHADKIAQLYEKTKSHVLHVAFCGHFSAGKSSLINRLCGHPLLPSSPIPTSANVVTIRNGSPGAFVARRGEAGRSKQRDSVGLERLEAFCVNGEEIESVEIRYSLPFLADRMALLDTPGIDSTDEAHMQATESALHLADVVFYVMDYNHVQSEINFAFARRMSEWSKPLYLIVNQIDKHKDHELSFEEYADSVKQAFADWNIHPAGFLFVSVKHPHDPHDEWGKLQWLMERLREKAQPLNEIGAIFSLRRLIKQHALVMAERHETEKAGLRERMADDSGHAETLRRYEQVRQETDELKERPLQLQEHLKREASSTIENANITPAVTRDLAHHYLQSRKPGFKVGLFGGAAKTKSEIDNRLLAFQRDFSEKISVELRRHLHDLLRKTAAAYELDDRQIGATSALNIDIPQEWLASQVSAGAVFSNEYTLNYCRQIASEVRSLYRRKMLELSETLKRYAEQMSQIQLELLQKEAASLQERLSAYLRLQELEQQEEAYERSLLRLTETKAKRSIIENSGAGAMSALLADLSEYAPQGGDEFVPDRKYIEGSEPGGPSRNTTNAGAARKDSGTGVDSVENAEISLHRRRVAEMANGLDEAAGQLADVPGMQSVSRSLKEKAARLRANRYTIALFGAFSAGKSSFANALIGENALPVSPNPTTAAINRIVPADEEWPHGTVKVSMKAKEAVVRDVRHSLETLGCGWIDMDDALRRISKLDPTQIPASGKPHYAFLKAVEHGWAEAEADLGRRLRVDLPSFRTYVAQESKSCFVESIELHYACPLTEHGISLVDTPGADSINARHTGVAFNYIKNADAVLFVTYYNHAFSHADREFLLQLGRVKDSFELDKMFFVVNAADLAASEQELAEVVKHVEVNLLSHGIRNPRIYPLSSMLGLQGKRQGDPAELEQSGLASFERGFFRFIYEELSQVAVHAAKYELQRAVSTLERWLEGAKADERKRQEETKRLRQAVAQTEPLLKQSADESARSEIAQEISELLYYVKQRIFFRFGELFNAAFNPTRFRNEKLGWKVNVRAAGQEFVRLFTLNLSQEVLATTLRVEQYLNQTAEREYLKKEWQIQQLLPAFAAERYEPRTFATPEVDETFGELVLEDRWLQQYFKSGKQFFAGGGAAELRTALEQKCAEPVQQYLLRHGETMETVFLEQYGGWTAQLKAKLAKDVNEHAEGLSGALQMNMDLAELSRKRDALNKLIEETGKF